MNDSASKFWLVFPATLFGILFLSNHLFFIGPALHLRTLLTALLPLLAFFPLANGTLARFKGYDSLSPVGELTYSSFLSLAYVSAFAFFLLTAHLAYPIVFPVLATLLILVSWPWWKKRILQIWDDRENFHWTVSPVEKVFLAVISILALAAAILPPLGYDAHEYHLAVPQAYLSEAGWQAFSTNVYAAFPMNVEMLYLWPIASSSAAGCTIVNLQFAIIATFAVWCLSVRWGISRNTLMVPIVFLSTGLVIRLILQANIDLGLTASAAVLLLAYERYRERESNIDLFMMTTAIGFALGAKYIAILSVVVPFSVMVFVDAALTQRKKLAMAWAIVMAGGLLIFSPWLIRNYLLYQNPVYPLLVSIFGGEPSFFSDVFSRAHASPNASFLETLQAFFVIPIQKVFWESSLKIPQFTCLWLLGIPVILKTRRDHPAFRTWVFLAAVYTGWFFATQRNDRFLASMLPFMALMPAYALEEIPHINTRKAARIFIYLIIAIQVWFSAKMTISGETVDYMMSPAFEEDYLAERLPHYRAIDWLNQRKSEEGKITQYKPIENVLFVGEAQSYGVQFPCTVPTVFNHHPLEHGLPSNVSHIFYNGFELDRLRKGYGPLGWTLGDRLQDWIQNSQEDVLKSVFDAYPEKPGRIVVYEIRNR